MKDETLFNTTMDDFVSSHGKPILIIHGGAKGADFLASKWALKNGIPLMVSQPDWAAYDKSAGPLRNGDIIKECDVLVAFPHPSGKGTQDAIQKALKAKKPAFIVNLL